ncbi:MAG: TraB/GumN family protein [Caulobacteraceae bacterium]|nr:TraB/GumN family protein [Caulobacteraceae bacterium]
MVVAPRRNAAPSAERCTTGPAWWRAAKGGAVVWIIGVPEQLPMDVAWDDACLRLRLTGARMLIVPPSVSGDLVPARTVMRPAKAPLNQRLPPALWGRLARRLSDNALRARDEMASLGLTRPRPGGPPPPPPPAMVRSLNRADLPGDLLASAPLLYAPTLLVARRLATALDAAGALGDPVAMRALDLAGRAGLLVNRLPRSGAQLAAIASAYNPSEVDQQACLDKVLVELDAGHGGLGLSPSIEAWARGDYQDGLRRMNVLTACSYGTLSNSFWSGLVTQGVSAVERAAAGGGTTVAVLELDTLLNKDGIIERLARTGWTVTLPEGLQ